MCNRTHRTTYSMCLSSTQFSANSIFGLLLTMLFLWFMQGDQWVTDGLRLEAKIQNCGEENIRPIRWEPVESWAKRNTLHQPGIEPRANAWKAFMLPLHHWCFCRSEHPSKYNITKNLQTKKFKNFQCFHLQWVFKIQISLPWTTTVPHTMNHQKNYHYIF